MATRTRSYVFRDHWGWRWHCVRCDVSTMGPHGGVGWAETRESARLDLRAHNRQMRGIAAHATPVRSGPDYSGLPPWHRRPDARPVQMEEITPEMLRPVQGWADRSRLPQTVWPSEYFGANFEGIDCLLISAAMPVAGWQHPHAAPDSQPLLTVLPRSYYYGCDPSES